MEHHRWVILVTTTLNSESLDSPLTWDALLTTLSSNSPDNPQTRNISHASQAIPPDMPLPPHRLARLTRTLSISISTVLVFPRTRLRNMLTSRASWALPTPTQMFLMNPLCYQTVLYRAHSMILKTTHPMWLRRTLLGLINDLPPFMKRATPTAESKHFLRRYLCVFCWCCDTISSVAVSPDLFIAVLFLNITSSNAFTRVHAGFYRCYTM